MPSVRRLISILLLLALAALPGLAVAQTDVPPINLGDTVEGALESGQLSAQYLLSGARGDVVTITLESDAFDGYLTLLDPGLNEVAADDDSAGGTNPLIENFELPTTGEFTILVDSYNGLQTGDFTLSVSGTAAEVVDTPEATASAESVEFQQGITFGDSLTGTITPDVTAHQYSFEAIAGQQVTINLVSHDFDSYVTLQNDGGEVLAEDDDSGGNLNARIEDFELPDDGAYHILVGSYGGGVDGEYTLTLTEAGAANQITPTTIPTPEAIPTTLPDGETPEIAVGDTVNGTIEPFAGTAAYTLNGLARQEVTITLESDAFDAYLQLEDASGQMVAEDDDSAGNLNARIEAFELPVDGAYRILVGSFSGVASGDYTLVVEGTTPTVQVEPTTTPDIVDEPDAMVQTIRGTLTEDERTLSYPLDGGTGEVITITLESTEFDSYLSLLDAAGNEIASDDDSASNLNARLENVELPDDGAYTIEVTSLGSLATGDFVLTIERSGADIVPTTEPGLVPLNAITLQLGDTITGELTNEALIALYIFNGGAGQIVRFTLESDDFDPYLSLLDAAGNEIASDDDSAGNLNARITDFELPDAGTYTLALTSAGGNGTGSFTLTTAAGQIQPSVEPTPVIAPPGTINIGDVVSSSLNDGANAHDFVGRAGEAVTIDLSSDDFDAYLQLENADGVELMSDDDGGGNLNARIENFTLPDDGTYVIVVSSFDGTGAGDYTLTLSEGGAVVQPITPTQVAGDADLTFGDEVDGALDGSQTEAYTFQGETGQYVTITLLSEDFDTYLRLLDPNEDELITDDDSAGGLDSRIGFFRLPQTGTYTIVVESYDGESGDYTLGLELGQLTPLEYRQTVDGMLSSDVSAVGYRFTGAADDVITITLESSSFDTYLSLAEAADSSYPLITDDDGGGGTDSRIGPFTLPSTGDYIVTVSSFDETEFGAYTLRLDRAVVADIEFDQPLTAQITAETSSLYYQFEGTTGEVISIRADSGGSVDTSLSLTGPDNYELISDDDSGADFDPEISRFVLTSDGTYTIGLQPYASGDEGEVTLTLSRGVVLSLDDGPQEIQLSDKVTQDVVTFTGVAGQNYQLWVRVREGISSPSVTITQDGETVATASASSANALLVAFIVPNDGTVTVQISDYNYEKVTLSVRVETVGE